jgi:hypothetical protein
LNAKNRREKENKMGRMEVKTVGTVLYGTPYL